jgi:hypothetical protein
MATMDFDEIMRADRERKQETVRQAKLAAQAQKEAEVAAALRVKTNLAAVTPLLKTMRARWEKRFKSFPEYRCVGQSSPPTGLLDGVRWIRLSISPTEGASESKNFDLHASADLDTGTVQVLGYSERYPTITIESGLTMAELTEEKADELLAKFATWFTSMGRPG